MPISRNANAFGGAQFELSIAESLRPIAFLFAELGGILNGELAAAGRVARCRLTGSLGKFEGGFPLPSPCCPTRIVHSPGATWIVVRECVQQFIGYLTGWLSVIANRRSFGLIRLHANHWLDPIDYGQSAASDRSIAIGAPGAARR